MNTSISFVLCGVVSRYLCHIPKAISAGLWLDLLEEDLVWTGVEPAPVVEV